MIEKMIRNTIIEMGIIIIFIAASFFIWPYFQEELDYNLVNALEKETKLELLLNNVGGYDNVIVNNEYSTNETREITTDTTENMEQTENWTEDENKTKDTTQNTTHDITEDTTKDTKGKTFNNGKEDQYTGEAESETNNERKTSDIGNTEEQRGFMNVSASSLLQAFRDTFINIDEMIINDLRDCFMEVF